MSSLHLGSIVSRISLLRQSTCFPGGSKEPGLKSQCFSAALWHCSGSDAAGYSYLLGLLTSPDMSESSVVLLLIVSVLRNGMDTYIYMTQIYVDMCMCIHVPTHIYIYMYVGIYIWMYLCIFILVLI